VGGEGGWWLLGTDIYIHIGFEVQVESILTTNQCTVQNQFDGLEQSFPWIVLCVLCVDDTFFYFYLLLFLIFFLMHTIKTITDYESQNRAQDTTLFHDLSASFTKYAGECGGKVGGGCWGFLHSKYRILQYDVTSHRIISLIQRLFDGRYHDGH